ncbi:hypothetical protein GN956_G26518, partial [Arapaima gigas]
LRGPIAPCLVEPPQKCGTDIRFKLFDLSLDHHSSSNATPTSTWTCVWPFKSARRSNSQLGLTSRILKNTDE